MIFTNFFKKKLKQFIWRLYDIDEIITNVSFEIYANRLLWIVFASLICFEVVE